MPFELFSGRPRWTSRDLNFFRDNHAGRHKFLSFFVTTSLGGTNFFQILGQPAWVAGVFSETWSAQRGCEEFLSIFGTTGAGGRIFLAFPVTTTVTATGFDLCWTRSRPPWPAPIFVEDHDRAAPLFFARMVPGTAIFTWFWRWWSKIAIISHAAGRTEGGRVTVARPSRPRYGTPKCEPRQIVQQQPPSLKAGPKPEDG